jgi:4-hydroxy-tetrahydrodipicolinate synthase
MGARPNIRCSARVYSKTLKLSGSICALATPFRPADDALDLDAFARLIDYQIEGGTRALVVAGSTGEGAALEADEFAQLLAFTVQKVDKRVPVIAGTGLQSTAKTIAQTRLAAEIGADAALVVTPPYVRPTQEGLYRHFSEVAERGGLPIILYNVPTRTAVDLLPETVARLHQHSGIVGIKEAVADAARMTELLSLRTESFAVLSGDDATFVRAMLAGADGVISVATNIAPAAVQALCVICAQMQTDAATLADQKLQALYAWLGVQPNPIPVKWGLEQLGLGSAHLRLPLLPLAEAYHSEGRAVLSDLGLLCA